MAMKQMKQAMKQRNARAPLALLVGALSVLVTGGAWASPPAPVLVDFYISVDDYAYLSIDGQPVASYDDYPWGEARGSASLAPGWHDIRLDYANRWGSTHVGFYYKLSSETDYRLVPRTALRSQNAGGATIDGLRADYAGEGLAFTRWGEAPILAGWPSLYEGQPATLWAGVYDVNWGVFSESLTGQILIAPGGSSDLRVESRDDPDPVVVGGLVTYTFNVHNNGPDDALGVTGSIAFPAELQFNSIASTRGNCNSATCDFGSLASGEVAEVTLVMQAVHAGRPTVKLEVTSQGSDPDPSNNVAREETFVQGASVDLVASALYFTVPAPVHRFPAALNPPLPVNAPLVLTAEVQNNGSDEAPPFAVDFYISTDDRISPTEDIFVGRWVASQPLAGGATAVATVATTLPGLPDSFFGKVWFGANVDADDDVAETDEGNNSNSGAARDHVSVQLYDPLPVRAWTAPFPTPARGPWLPAAEPLRAVRPARLVPRVPHGTSVTLQRQGDARRGLPDPREPARGDLERAHFHPGRRRLLQPPRLAPDRGAQSGVGRGPLLGSPLVRVRSRLPLALLMQRDPPHLGHFEPRRSAWSPGRFLVCLPAVAPLQSSEGLLVEQRCIADDPARRHRHICRVEFGGEKATAEAESHDPRGAPARKGVEHDAGAAGTDVATARRRPSQGPDEEGLPSF
jgi:uncharacterized repeat protein (TIGR01451 family)